VILLTEILYMSVPPSEW